MCDLLKIPNLFSLARLLAAPLVFYFFSLPGTPGKILTLAFLLIIYFTDFLDGYLARKLDQCSDLGRILDPLADKVLLLLLVIALIMYRGLPLFVLFIILGRDLAILLGGFFLIIRKKIVVEANIWGKTATVAMMIVVLLYVLEVSTYILLPCLIAGLLLIVFSLLTYLFAFLNQMGTPGKK
jgi:CDP-diacylglycerol--glycerol-3-phosphate 3-phosphatidyltransferase